MIDSHLPQPHPFPFLFCPSHGPCCWEALLSAWEGARKGLGLRSSVASSTRFCTNPHQPSLPWASPLF